MSSPFPPKFPPTPLIANSAAPDISADDLVRYLSKKHVGVCPCCGTNNFVTGNLLQGQLQALATYSASGPGPAYQFAGPFPVAFMPTVHVICQNCGFIEMYSAVWVRRWLDENPA